jgi:hypothetical protein
LQAPSDAPNVPAINIVSKPVMFDHLDIVSLVRGGVWCDALPVDGGGPRGRL